MNTFGKYVRDDNEIKGIHPGNIKIDICQIYILNIKETIKNHCSKI